MMPDLGVFKLLTCGKSCVATSEDKKLFIRLKFCVWKRWQMRDDGMGGRLLRKQKAPSKPDRLLSELERVERRLQKWMQSSPQHAQLFRSDPLAAMQAAGLDIDDEIMLELERVVAAIAGKLR
ncbi:MAG TPA: hypothetical protein VF532_23250 [Candidatus Angelobacter sp.]